VDEILDQCFGKSLDELEPLFAQAHKIAAGRRSNALHFYVPGLVHYDTPFFKSSNRPPNAFRASR